MNKNIKNKYYVAYKKYKNYKNSKNKYLTDEQIEAVRRHRVLFKKNKFSRISEIDETGRCPKQVVYGYKAKSLVDKHEEEE